MNTIRPHPILLFDGVCNLCEGFVQFIIRHDKKGRLQLGSLQSEEGKALLREYGINEDYIGSVVLIENGKAYTHSTAALRACRYLSAPWRWLRYLTFIPRLTRDKIYHFIARNRYKWFGKKQECWLPTPELKKRFIENS